MILFSDAADSEEPGSYPELISEMVSQNTTVSVIGLGTDADVDAQLLRDIARRGGGRIFSNEDATALPALFAQESVAVPSIYSSARDQGRCGRWMPAARKNGRSCSRWSWSMTQLTER